MIKLKFIRIALIYFFTTNFLPKRLLFRKKNSDEMYFAYIDPKLIDKTSYIEDMSNLFIGESAFYGAVSGLWGRVNFDFKNNIVSQLCNELMNDKKGKTYQYIVERHSIEQAEHIWNKLLRLRASFIEKGYMSQYEMGKLSDKHQVGSYRLPSHETFIGLNKKGEFIRLCSGRHRLALAQQMKIDRIPVLITLHHPGAKKFLPINSRLLTGDDSDYRPFD